MPGKGIAGVSGQNALIEVKAMLNGFRPKKHLGQHFLTDEYIAKRIADSIQFNNGILLEIGPGKGALTNYLHKKWAEKLWLVEIDHDAVVRLNNDFPRLIPRIIEGDFLKLDMQSLFKGDTLSIAGNFPYNISSQILFKVIEASKQVAQLTGMFQEEVARRICSPPGNKNYGILSVLVQTYFETSYLFSVPPSAFMPVPAVNSGVIRLVLKKGFKLQGDERFFKTVVKTAFNQRRKMLSNALSGIAGKSGISKKYANLRAEELLWKDFEELAAELSEKIKSAR